MPAVIAPHKSLLVAESQSMKSVLADIESFGMNCDPVLIEGEPGSGRELIARLLHLRSDRCSEELVSIKGGGARAELFACPVEAQSESLFPGAQGGTLLVRDICELPKKSQRKLSAALHRGAEGANRPLDIRVIATSDPGLGAAVQAGVFYEPLHRLVAAQTIVVPPLRERKEDLLPLMKQLVSKLAKDIGRGRLSVSTRASDALLRYPWPGNVAELKQVARRLVVRAQGSHIEASDVDAVLPCLAQRAPLEDLSFEDLLRHKLADLFKRVEGYPLSALHEEVLGLVEKPLLQLVLEHTGGNQLRASEILGLSRNTLRRRLVDFGLVGRPSGYIRAKASTARQRATSKKPGA